MSGLQSFYFRDVGHTQYLAYGADNNFIDITRTGTISSARGYNGYQSIPLGFTYNYYGRNISSVYVTTNGHLNLDGSRDNSNRALPSTAEPRAMIAPYWDYFYNYNNTTYGSRRIQYQTIGSAPNRTFIVQWQNLRFRSYSDTLLSFQVRIHESDRTMEFAYGGMLSGRAYSISRRQYTSGGITGVAIQNYNRNAGITIGNDDEGVALSGSWFVFTPTF